MSLPGKGLTVVAVLVVGLALGTPAEAQYFRWTDEQGNSHYTDGLHNIPERYRASAVPLRLRPSPPSVPAPPSPPPPETTAKASATSPDAVGSTTIRYVPGRPILVEVTINGRGRARLVLETEAEATLIKPSVLASAGVTLPSGGGQALQVTLDSLALGEARVKGMAVLAQDGRAEDGLLGRDFLDRFTVANDREEGVLTLTPR